MSHRLTMVTFTVRATEKQSLQWKRWAAAEGHVSVGVWLAFAADRHLEAIRRAGKPIPLGWRQGRFDVALAAGAVNVRGMISLPFGYYRGDDGRSDIRSSFFTLVYLPAEKIIATLRSAKQVKALAAELAGALLRGELPDAGQVVGRHVRESV